MATDTKEKSKLELTNDITLKFRDEYNKPLPDNIKIKIEVGDKDKLKITAYILNGEVSLNKVPVGTAYLSVYPRNTIIEKADKAGAKSTLKNAVDKALLSAEILKVDDKATADKTYEIQANGKLAINVRSKFEDHSSGDEQVSLALQDERGKNVSKTQFSAVTTSAVVENVVFDKLKEGKYKISIQREKKINPSKIKVKIWPEVFSGPGIIGSNSNKPDNFELTTGIKTTETKAEGKLFGEYVLRSEPLPQSYIFGKLPKNNPKPIEVEILDKKSFNRNTGDTWYKVKFKNKLDYEQIANISFNYEIKFKNKAKNRIYNVKVPAGFANANKLYSNQEAWISGQAVKIYLPFDKLQKMIEAFEKLPEIKSLPLLDRITYLRRLYDWDGKLRSEQVIRQIRKERKSLKITHDRSALSKVFSLINKHENTGFKINDKLFDAGHLFLTLDAYNHFDNLTKVSHAGATLESGSARASASWSGDVGAVVSDYIASQLAKKQIDRTKVDADDLEQKYNSRAPDDDLLGNILGVACYLILRDEKITTLSELLKKLSSKFTSNTKNALRYFLASYGYKNVSQLPNSSHKSYQLVYDEVYQFGSSFLISRLPQMLGKIVGTVAAAKEYFTRSEYKFCQLVSHSVAARFLQDLENMCKTYSVSDTNVKTSKSVIITRPNDNLHDREISNFLSDGHVFPGAETRKIKPRKIFGTKNFKINWAGAPHYMGPFKVTSGTIYVVMSADHEHHVVLDAPGKEERIYVDLKTSSFFSTDYEEIIYHEGTYTQAWHDIPAGEYKIGIRSNTAYDHHKLIGEITIFESIL